MTFRNLFCFRKLCRDCKKVLDYLAISEVIETMEDLVQFVKDLRNVLILTNPLKTTIRFSLCTVFFQQKEKYGDSYPYGSRAYT
jgi:hypothetical protein